jgi:hypothetical protein
MELELLLIVAVVSMLVGAFVAVVVCCGLTRKDKPIGSLRVDTSDPDSEPLLFLEVNSGQIDRLYKQKIVTLRVNLESYLRK